ncbi:LacI family DNA-binding transcriptional regulator [Brevibacillus centrosporus]|uniref:LacI family DNA-binding transcriptional regulator n=1 Tax=Brevibacillus centrosporus TaxID=54910 RepID=UPI000F09CF2C|nr:LacI family DNA-binding transcriptional regulator [Brevibacillus centrosporus]MEC2129578.1 LacI family DNA-binding transcriptional regulator [Brevibacillus centrosporus]RNB65435.1 LacI family transcriptional regulator [Brevibacillus centrosporus]GED29932.1 LacI family transcriptional regulator [Brevibacillus centrosporus]
MKKVTIKDVAKHAGVSIGTVSKVLNDKGYVSSGIYSRVTEAISELNYQVNANARSLKASKTNKVGVIVQDISNPYMMSIAKTIEDKIRPSHYHMLVMSHNEDPHTERELLQLILEQRVDGLVLVPTSGNADMIQKVLDHKIPVILVDRKVEGITTDYIVDDNYYGSYESIAYLHSLGHRRIGVIYGTTNSSIGKERYEGAVDALKHFACSNDEALLVSGKFKAEDAYKATIELLFLPDPPTAIYCCNNTMTVGMLKAIQEQAWRFPEDISIISYGDVNQWELIQPPLTLMTQPLKRIGVEAAIILKNRLTMEEPFPPKQIVIKPELLVRASCARRPEGE